MNTFTFRETNATGVLSSRTRRGGKRKRLIESKIEFSFPPTNKSVQIQAKLSLRVPGWKQNPIFVSSPRNRCARRNQSCCSKQVVVPFFFLPLPRLVRTISLGRVPSWIPGGIFPGDEASRSAGRLSLANVEGRAKRIKAGAGSGAIIQSSGQLGSIVLIAFHGGRCRQESILSLGLTLSMLHTMSFIINVTGTFQSEGSSTTAEISSPGCSSNLDRIDRYGGGELIHSGRILLDTFASFVLSECITLFRLR